MMEIKEILQKLNEYTEEPDAFETETERQMEQDLENNLDKAILKNEKENKAKIYSLYNYLKKMPWAYDLNLKDDIIKFVVQKERTKGFEHWKETSNLLNYFKIEKYNTGEGFIITLRK